MVISKFTISNAVSMTSVYNDGAGNSCTYTYSFSAVTTTHYMSDIWKLNFLEVRLPSVAVTALVATATGSVVGAPPAAATRTINITTGGIVTFDDANESISYEKLKCTLTTVGDHPYTLWDIIGLVGGVTWDQVAVSTNTGATGLIGSPVSDVILEDIGDFGQAAQWCQAQFYPSATDVAANRIRPFGLAFVEGELMSREYRGAYIELALKGVITLMRARKGLSPLTYGLLEVADYLQGDGPLDHFTPYKESSILMAE